MDPYLQNIVEKVIDRVVCLKEKTFPDINTHCVHGPINGDSTYVVAARPVVWSRS